MPNSYSPLQIGIAKETLAHVAYSEQKPDSALSSIVHCFWTLKTLGPLKDDFIYTVMPDACIDIVFDMTSGAEPIIMTPHIKIETLNLGTQFHYIGIRFKPGVLNEIVNIKNIVGHQQKLSEATKLRVDSPTNTNAKEQYSALARIVQTMIDAGMAKRNPTIENIVRGLQYGLSVNDIAEKTGYSVRHLRRKVAAQTGFSPVQLRRVLRFQTALSSEDVSLRFADQSHLIKEFKAVTGMSYKTFISSFTSGRKVQ